MRRLPGVFRALVAALLIAIPTLVAAAPLRPRLGIEAGGSLGHLSNNDLLGQERWGAGGQAGLIARWEFVPGWSFEAVPGWESPAARGTGGFDTFQYEQTVRLHRITLPMRVAYRPGATAWSLEGGLVPSWLAHASHDTKQTSGPSSAYLTMARGRAGTQAQIFETVGTIRNGDWTRFFHRWDLAVSAGLGWEHPFASHVFCTRVRWQEGLSDIGKVDETIRISQGTAQIGVLW